MSDEILKNISDLAWKGNGYSSKSITFCVTEECNLACKYCYMTGKNSSKKMNFEVAKKAVDFILNDEEICNTGAVVWDFIGGEPFLEIELIDKICDYIKQKMFLLNHHWFNAYRFNFSSNGILYNTSKVQKFISKNKGHLSIGISIDGNEKKHDLQRIYPDGKGSFRDVIKNLPLWLEQFPGAQTKATFAHDDLPLLKDSIIELWKLGFNNVSANVVFEDVWDVGDDIIFENQLKELADYIIDNKLWDKHSVRFFNPNIGQPLSKREMKNNYCGAGEMLAIDCEGNFYPCIRFLDFSLSNKKGRKIGDINSYIDMNKLRPFKALTLKHQSTQNCIDCEVATGCAWCTGCNYDLAESDTIYDRATNICKMHKANVRSNEYFWERYYQAIGEKKQSIEEVKFLKIILDDSIEAHCNYSVKKSNNNKMDENTLNNVIKFAKDNKLIPIIVGDTIPDIAKGYLSIASSKSNFIKDNTLVIYDSKVDNIDNPSGNSILNIKKEDIYKLYDLVKELSIYNDRININIVDIEGWNNSTLSEYKIQLEKLVELVVENYKNDNELEISCITDRLNLEEMCNCDAGVESYTVAPNGKFYLCPAFYYDDEENYIKDIEYELSMKKLNLLTLSSAPLCTECDAYHCKRCIFLNKKLTCEYNIPSELQCNISYVEREVTRQLQERLVEERLIDYKKIPQPLMTLSYNDPIKKIIK
jgi:uncharacterized protein